MKKLIAVILSAMMIFSVLSPAVSAANGKCNCGTLPTIYVGPLGNTDIYEDFGTENQSETKNNNGMGQKLLRRSRTDRSIAGVCAGLANYLGIDTTLVRILTLCLIIFGGMSLWVYIILWLLIPEE